ncbi:MAG: hypothetical protein QM758_00650 [Armatimonas sp.]
MYEKEWRKLERYIACMFLSMICGFLLMGAIAGILDAAGGHAILATPLIPVWFISNFYFSVKWSLFPCPRCKEPFFKANSWSVNQLGSTCPHCGLKKFATK